MFYFLIRIISRKLACDPGFMFTVYYQLRYRRWLCWTRFGTVITISQIVGALYLTVVTIKEVSYNSKEMRCFLGKVFSNLSVPLIIKFYSRFNIL